MRRDLAVAAPAGRRLRLLLPLALAVCSVLIDVLPLLGLGPGASRLFSTLCVVYFEPVPPDLFGTSAAFATGIIYDALAGCRSA